MGGVFTPLVERNTTIPTQKKQVFSTAADNQPAVTIVVLQGERKMASDNKEIGRFDLADIPPAPRGMPQIEVCLDIDANGILNVSAKDLKTGKEQKIKIEAKSGLSEDEIKRMLKDAEENQEADKIKKEQVEARNEADATAFRAEKALADYKDKIPQELAANIQSKVDAIKDALKGQDLDLIKKARHDLEQTMQKMGEAMQNAAPQGQPAGQAEEPEVQEADVEIVDDKK
jgi:molecular chaperone DnaK